MANACACGCGQLLPEGSTRQYKRGHKSRIPESVTGDSPDNYDDETGFTIEDAIRDTPDDPEPSTPREFKLQTPKVKVTAAVRKDIEGKLAFVFGMTGETWAMVDPVCGMTLASHGADMAKRYTPLVCQSPDLVRVLTRGGTFILWVDAFMATLPLLQVVFAHHIAKSLTPDMASPNGYVHPTPDMYTVS